MSCVKNCEREVPELNMRPIGIDYGLPWLIPPQYQNLEHFALSQVETNFWMGALLTLLQGSILVHYMPRILADLGLDPAIALATPAFGTPFLTHTLVTGALLLLPGLMSLSADNVSVPIENLFQSISNALNVGDSRDESIIIEVAEKLTKEEKPFKALDLDGNGLISSWECERALQSLDVDEKKTEVVMTKIATKNGSNESWPLPVEEWLSTFQELFTEAQQKVKGRGSSGILTNTMQTKKSLVEIFNALDTKKRGFITKSDFISFLDKKEIGLSGKDMDDLFTSADIFNAGYLTLFEFMTAMRKVVRVGIQEIGFGSLPLTWASLTAYWLGLGMKEFGTLLARFPDTFYLALPPSIRLPQFVASTDAVHLTEGILMVAALQASMGLTKKLCDDNRISGARFGVHALFQAFGTHFTLYLMLSPNPLLA